MKREERSAQKEAGRLLPGSPLPSPRSRQPGRERRAKSAERGRALPASLLPSALSSLPPGRRVRAITFDVGGTLIKPWPSVGHIYSQVAARHGFPGLSVATLNRQFIAAWGAAKEFDYSRLAWAQLVDETFRGLTDKPPSQTFFAKLHSRFAQPEAWRVFEDVVPTLETLTSRRIRLGVISNWDERLRPLLRRLNLHDYFEAIVVSCEVGFTKPSPVIFELAAEKLAVPPEAVLHVGDSPTNDVEGARAAGLEAVLLKRGASKATGGMNSLRQLLRRLNLRDYFEEERREKSAERGRAARTE